METEGRNALNLTQAGRPRVEAEREVMGGETMARRSY